MRRAACRSATCGRRPSAAKGELAGAIVLAPPWRGADRWARRLAEPGRLRWRPAGCGCASAPSQRGVELPLVISDHADWDELNATLDEVGAPEVWVTHGREEALIHAAGSAASGAGRCGWWAMARRTRRRMRLRQCQRRPG